MAQETKHTPGPWKVVARDTTFGVEAQDGLRVVSTSWHGSIRHPFPLKGEAWANARLASTAPDFLDAAKDLVACRTDTYRAGNNRQVGIEDENGEKCWIVTFDEMHALERAIAKAEGAA